MIYNLPKILDSHNYALFIDYHIEDFRKNPYITVPKEIRSRTEKFVPALMCYTETNPDFLQQFHTINNEEYNGYFILESTIQNWDSISTDHDITKVCELDVFRQQLPFETTPLDTQDIALSSDDDDDGNFTDDSDGYRGVEDMFAYMSPAGTEDGLEYVTTRGKDVFRYFSWLSLGDNQLLPPEKQVFASLYETLVEWTLFDHRDYDNPQKQPMRTVFQTVCQCVRITVREDDTHGFSFLLNGNFLFSASSRHLKRTISYFYYRFMISTMCLDCQTVYFIETANQMSILSIVNQYFFWSDNDNDRANYTTHDFYKSLMAREQESDSRKLDCVNCATCTMKKIAEQKNIPEYIQDIITEYLVISS